MLYSYNRIQIASGEHDINITNYNVFNVAHNISGLDWNYFIAPYLDRDLHEKLLEVTQQEMAPIITTVTMILSLIRSGYFYTASVVLAQLDVSKSKKLTAIKTWLLQALAEADDTGEV